MKKLYFLFIILTSSQIFSQTTPTYSVDVEYYRFSNGCNNSNVPAQTRKTCDANTTSWNLKNGSTTIATENISLSPVTNTYSIPLLSSYSLSAQVFCSCSGGVPSVPYYVCSESATQTILANGYTYNSVTTNAYGIERSIMSGGYAGGFSIGPSTQVCIGTVIVKNFRPNGITISKVNPSVPAEYIAGQQVDFFAVTPGPTGTRFPDVAYHWQYSLDNKVTWIDAPVSMSNRPNPSFSIKDLLGEIDHVNHFGPIDFRLGYNDRAFTDPYRIMYKPGTVLVKDRTFENPNCYEDDVKNLVVYFDRKLETGETLSILHIVPYPKPAQVTPMLVQPEVTALTYDADTKWYKYKFNIPAGTNLENRYYVIEYQSSVNGAPRGTLAMGEPFLYEAPTPVKFIIQPLTHPSCNNDLVEVKMNVMGGTGTYRFYVDNTLITPTPTKEGDGFYHIRNLNPNAENIIKVTDSKDCIEKNI
ncbi:hypothetical protein [Flavobacterium phragmitis]|uniref:Uncharacterized protein n=1 Tax=Flavobacterium phragmitis TaxID=739143 RepID=A0A1I1M0N7_9FLAO|nr:hypothetical protein [Flavobacterium phragmitis]SFC78939.1 hypothetical protein SAMN05216297_102287 [Flavobacterium phragmitis]